jgi:leader peptidase (prepilin peptidase)/N-methyltransferase
MTLGGGLLSFALGALLGTFANICIDQLPKGLSPATSRPTCEACGTPYRLNQFIPVLGYMTIRGRCASCNHPVHWRAPLVEVSSGLLALACYVSFGLSLKFISSAILLVVALTAGVIDREHQIIPNALTLPCLGLGLALSFLPGHPTPVDSILGLVVAGGLLALAAWAYPKGMGGGDVKFMAMAGAFLGWMKALVVIFTASLAAVVVGLTLVVIGRQRFRDPLPFGPYLCFGVLVAVFS